VIGGFVERVARLDTVDLPGAAARYFAVWPEAPDVSWVPAAVDALRAMTRRWQALPVGGALTVDWPAHRRMVAPDLRRRAGDRPARVRV
jgi:hypothetical protein